MIGILAFSSAKEEFDKDWQNPDYTQIELEPVDVNGVLEKHFFTSEPLHFTRQMLWDMEAKKAWDPRTYIPHVVRVGTSWGRKTPRNREEYFVRSSQQLAWISNDYGQVWEEFNLVIKVKRLFFLESRGL